MEKKNNNGVLTGLLIGIIIMLLVFVCLFATNTIRFNTQKLINKNKQKSEDIKENTSLNNTIKNFYSIDELKIKTLDEYKVFSDISNNRNIIETIDVDHKYYAELNLSGQVEIRIDSNEGWVAKNLNIDKIIDIILFNIPAEDSEQIIYLLSENGDVYSYKIGEANNNNYNVIKIENVSNVKKFFISNFSRENAGGSWALFAITKENESIMLNAESV